MNQFLTIIGKVKNQIMKLIKQTNIPYNETEEVIAMRDNATECYLCDRTFTEKDTRVIDHNHFTGEIRGIAHQSCNLHYHLQNTKIPKYQQPSTIQEVTKQGKNDVLKFKNLKQQVQIPYFFVGDFESILVKLYNQKKYIKNKNLKEIENYEKTEKIEKHEVLSQGLQIHSFDNKDDEYIEYVSNNSEDVIQHIMNTIIQKTQIFEERIQQINIPYNLTQQEQNELKNNAKECWICKKGYFKNDKDRVIDNNHLTGEVRGIAHKNCNLQFNLHNSKIPVIFHNLRNYDSQFIIQYIGNVIKSRVQKIEEEVQQLKQNYELNKQKLISKLKKNQTLRVGIKIKTVFQKRLFRTVIKTALALNKFF